MMPTGSNIKIFDRSNRAFNEMVQVTDDVLMRPFMEAAKARAKRYARTHTYYKTGKNQRSIIFRKGRAKGIAYYLMTTSGYGMFLELGTVHMVGRPYIGPAVKDTAMEFRPKRSMGLSR